MDIFYKPFHAARIVFCAIVFSFFLVASMAGVPAFAANPVFTIEDVKVDVTASNALEAKQKAFEQAQVDAFEIMANRMLSESEMKAAPPLDLSTISLLIQDFEVTKEQLSAVRYVGTYTFRFKDDAVRRHFSGQGFQYSDVGSKPVLILPFDCASMVFKTFVIISSARSHLSSLPTRFSGRVESRTVISSKPKSA